MQSINFDEGYKTYAINGDESRVIKVQVTDLNLPKRAQDAMAELQACYDKYDNITADDLVTLDKEFREVINKVFNSDICTTAFGEANIASPLDNGEPLCVHFFKAFMPILEEEISKTAESYKARPEVEQYLDGKEK